jgi:peptidoglycan/xylan/chitin deacetylase (PgdA/CDA1 family)
VLRRLGLPATFAIATGFVTERRPLWNDVLEFAVGHAPARRGVLAWDKTPIPYDTETLDGRLALFRALWAHGVEVDQLRRDALVSAAAAQLDVAVDASDVFRHPGYRPLHAGQIRDMADSGLAQFCSHSVHHYVLPRLSSAARRAELGRSKDDVEKLSGRPCTALCLPGGFHDRASLDDAFATGFTRVLTSDRRDADPSEPVMGRYVVVRSHTAAELAELVHAPLRRMAGWIRRRGAAAR